MNYQIGEYVVYNGVEICRVGETVKKDFTGTGETDYITLYPTQTQTTIYIPTDKTSAMLRSLLTKEKVMKLIGQMSAADIEPNYSAELNYQDAVKNGDYDSIIRMMQEIYIRNRSRAKSDKSFVKADKKIFDAAKKMIDSEFAFVLGINVSDVESFIQNAIAK